jgi:hypothetical protein
MLRRPQRGMLVGPGRVQQGTLELAGRWRKPAAVCPKKMGTRRGRLTGLGNRSSVGLRKVEMSIPGTGSLIETWQELMHDSPDAWVLFRHGTCVSLAEPTEDLGSQAIDLMKQWGRVEPGTSAGDFNILKLVEDPGWVVTSHHRAISTYVAPEELDNPNSSEVLIGLLGRSKRDLDAKELQIIQVTPKGS